MPFQLFVTDGEHKLTFPLPEGEHLVGSSPDCAIRLGHPAISRRHALLRVKAGAVEVEDLGSRNGTRVAGRLLSGRSAVAPGDSLTFGTVGAVIEDISAEDLEPAVRFGELPAAEIPEARQGATDSVGSLQVFAMVRLPELLAGLEAGDSPLDMTQAVGAALFDTLPCLHVQAMAPEAGAGDGILFAADRSLSLSHEPLVVTARNGAVALHVGFAHATQARSYRPLVEAGAALISLAGRRRGAGAAPPPPSGPPTELPRPPTTVPEVQAIYRDAARIARGDISALITGESGTGKEVLARYLHTASRRCGEPFVALNCAALPRDLLETELFGVESGVATGVSSRPGKFELADGGTLFLDEIGDMAPETQARILRVLQEGEVYRLGGQAPRSADVRVIAATNRDLEAMLSDGRFRVDLYHRIADWVVELPPLRRRQPDIPNLAAYFLQEEAARQARRVTGISRAALDALIAHDWPGNIRQLQREMARAALFLDDGDMLQVKHLQAAIRQGPPAPPSRSLKEKLERVERAAIEEALTSHGGNLSAVARELEIGRSTLYRRMRELGIEVDG